MQRKPLKRHIKLQKLSREHHQMLIFSLRLKKGLSIKVDESRLIEYTKFIMDGLVLPHMQLEENLLLSQLPKFGNKDRVLVEHQWFKNLHEKDNYSLASLNELYIKLENHIRFEERIFFQEIQKSFSDQLSLIHWENEENLSCLNWTDPFW